MSRRSAVPMLSMCLGIVLLIAAACAPIARPAPRVAVPAGQPAAEAATAPSNDITDIVWLWTKLSNRTTGETTVISDPQNYTITFRDDGTLSGKADCNTFTGTYTQEGGFFIQSTPDVMAACGGDSRDIQYLELLDSIVAGGPDGAGGLALETAGGEQRMEFANGGPAPAP